MTIRLYKWWKLYSTLGTDVEYTENENEKIELMNQAYFLSSNGFFISFLMILYYKLGAVLLFVTGITTIIFLLLPVLSYKKLPRIGWHVGSIFFIVAITATSLAKPACYANYTLYSIIIFLNIYVFEDNKKIQFFYLASILSGLIVFTYFLNLNPELNHGSPIMMPIVIVFLVMITNYVIIMLIIKNRALKEKDLDYAISLKNAALNATKDATIILDLNQKITGYNQQSLEMWGITETELKAGKFLGMLKRKLPSIINQEEVKISNNSIFQNPKVSTFDIVYFKKGKIIERYTQPQILDNKVVGRVFNFRDVTKQYEASIKLTESENRFRRLFEDSPLGIIISDCNNNIFKNVNKQFCEMLGYSKEELLQKSIVQITFPEHLENHLEYYEDFKKGHINNFKIKKKYIKKSGDSFWGNVNVSAVRDKDGAITSEIVMIEDVNEQKIQEEQIKDLIIELKSLNEELEYKVKMRTDDLGNSNKELKRSNKDLEQFAYIASHDLQEPLRMIGNFVQLLERQYKDKIDDEGREYIHYIVDGVSRMSKLIQNLLKYSRVGRKESKLRKIDLGKIIESKLYGLNGRIAETKANVQITKMPPPLYCEPDQMGMVFFNLLTNALKFNKGMPKIIIGYEEKENDLLFSVKDNGIGIDKRYETKVFEIFKRLHRREDYDGTGIGLALCEKIIARHGGRIWFESELEKGTTFYFTINKNLHNERHLSVDSNLIS